MLLKVLTLVLTAGVFPYTFTYEGRLYDSSGNVYNGQAEFVLKLYDVQEGGSPLWEESHTVDVKDGFFSIKVGDVNPLPDPFPSSAYLGIEVNSSGEMSPRLEVGSVPFSFISKKALSTERKILHTQILGQEIYLNKCVSDPSTCCYYSNPVYYPLPGASLQGEVGGNVLVKFSTPLQAGSGSNPDEQRGYVFVIYLDGVRISTSMTSCAPPVQHGFCPITINHLFTNLSRGEHKFEIWYCPLNPYVTGEVKTWVYTFDVIELP
jgi:hypothetical protein